MTFAFASWGVVYSTAHSTFSIIYLYIPSFPLYFAFRVFCFFVTYIGRVFLLYGALNNGECVSIVYVLDVCELGHSLVTERATIPPFTRHLSAPKKASVISHYIQKV